MFRGIQWFESDSRYFFTTNIMGQRRTHRSVGQLTNDECVIVNGELFTSISLIIPYDVIPRPLLQNGVVRDHNDVRLFLRDLKEIPNPLKKFSIPL
jgi:hypothetical protein